MALTDNLLGWWKLDESSGNAADATGGGYTLTNVNSTPFVTGKIGNAADFERDSGQYLQRTSGVSAFSLPGDISVSAWIYA